jgi:drug/metabolite transporter (DMT)-like permease
MLVALAAPYFLKERLAVDDLVAVALIVAGILVIGLRGASIRDRHAIFLSLATGVAIATYTMIDAAGARAGASPHTYTAWLFVLAAVAQLVVTGMTVAPAALVAAVRETSILFAALIGWVVLGERIARLRWIAAVLTVTGLIIVRL